MSPTQITGGLYIADIQTIEESETEDFGQIISVCQDDCSDNVLFEAIDAVIAARLRRKTVCVCCHTGRSRSTAVAIAAMAVLEGITWDQAFNHAQERRPISKPEPKLIEDARQYVQRRR